MKQILQSLKTGQTSVADVPCPNVRQGEVLMRTSKTLISAGTERMLVDFGKSGWIGKARQQPDKVKQVLEKIKTDGLMPTVDAVFNKLDQPLPLGYCNVGTVLESKDGIHAFKVGDRVVSNGKHAEAVAVPRNLCALVPENVSDEAAAFTVVGAIGLQGIRLVKPTLGESVVVMGLGLIGLLTVQLLRAQGCRVLGLDFDARKLALAEQFGAEVLNLSGGADAVQAGVAFSRGRGVDAVIITASTSSNDPVQHAARMSRKRGRIVLVGVTGLELSRADFYEKELSFQVSCSYGPGRYDPNYEDKGQDYPLAFVRWTEQRNFEAVLDMMADGRLNVAPLISHNFAFNDASDAYSLITSNEPSLGILLNYPTPDVNPEAEVRSRTVLINNRTHQLQGSAIAFIGAGNYASSTLVPAFKAAGAKLGTIASNSGVTATHLARKYGFTAATTDADAILGDDAVDSVVVTTRHNSHAAMVIKALEAGKNIFVEKPLALNHAELDQIAAAYKKAQETPAAPRLMVGFNRRFAPLVLKTRQLLEARPGPKAFTMTVNAGMITADHWTQDPSVGGGRIIGEACHFIDLLRHLADCEIVSHNVIAMAGDLKDTLSIQLGFADGSIGAIHYFANGSKALAKERLEIFASGSVLQLNNFRSLKAFGWPGFSKQRSWRQDKGQQNCARAFVEALSTGGPAPISFEELMEVAQVTIDIAAGV